MEDGASMPSVDFTEDRAGTTSIHSLASFFSAVEDVCQAWKLSADTIHPWFRGQQEAEWALIPGLYRGYIDAGFEREVLRDFKLRAPAYLSSQPRHDLEWFAIMQHYRMPTRFLDWTEHSLTALYFAIEKFEVVADACVWILDPWSLNSVAINQKSVPVIEHPRLQNYTLDPDLEKVSREIAAKLPVAIRPPRSTPRIVAQGGTFTIHGQRKNGLYEIAEEHNTSSSSKIRISRLIVNGQAKKTLMKQLYLAGISHVSLFPDLEGLSREISFRYSEAYLT